MFFERISAASAVAPARREEGAFITKPSPGTDGTVVHPAGGGPMHWLVESHSEAACAGAAERSEAVQATTATAITLTFLTQNKLARRGIDAEQNSSANC
jgi:hypothetical protein